MYEISFDISQSKFSKIMEISFAKLVLTYDITLEMIMTLKFFSQSTFLLYNTTTPQDAATRSNTHCRKRSRFLFGIFFRQNIRQARTKHEDVLK